MIQNNDRNRCIINGLEIMAAIIFFCIIAAATAAVVEDDVRCLRGVKSSLQDPQNNLVSWNFSNTTAGFICSFQGASCWNDKENRLIDLRLPSVGLTGQIPDSLQYCKSITTLDLSKNELNGSIPAGICAWLPYLVTLDLSGNSLSGPIPPELSSCKFLNTLHLNDNGLSGSIPDQLSSLNRLKKLSVANNRLSGSIPAAFSSFDPAGFLGNNLSGPPLGTRSRRVSRIIIIVAAGVSGAVVSLLVGFGLSWWCTRVREDGNA